MRNMHAHGGQPVRKNGLPTGRLGGWCLTNLKDAKCANAHNTNVVSRPQADHVFGTTALFDLEPSRKDDDRSISMVLQQDPADFGPKSLSKRMVTHSDVTRQQLDLPGAFRSKNVGRESGLGEPTCCPLGRLGQKFDRVDQPLSMADCALEFETEDFLLSPPIFLNCRDAVRHALSPFGSSRSANIVILRPYLVPVRLPLSKEL